MATDEADELTSPLGVDAELNELLGLFDAPAFARRGADLEYALSGLDARCTRERAAMLEMVRVRLRQWSAAVDGPDAWPLAFAAPIAPLWDLARADPPTWSLRPAAPRKIRGVARDLIASVERFNRRWSTFLGDYDLGPINDMIDRYNKYYLLEKECCLGSARLAARHFAPKEQLDPAHLLARFPRLPVPAPGP